MIIDSYTNGFGARLRAAMDYAGVRKNVDLADAVGVAEGTIRNYLKMARPPKNTKTIAIIASVLGVRSDWLLYGQGPMVEGGVAEAVVTYVGDIDIQLLGSCCAAVLDALERRGGARPPTSSLGAAIAEVYLICLRDRRKPTDDLVASFVRVMLA